ncbi:MAG: hypothetical protein CMI16_07260 [Opitutaceae bacterium]|nr:hypothetical protein [Opitutaceae bacterium]|tara:strand:+ start:1279 stop:2187 length:909 start_codon:yes stop_codon:yes gene_type:complete
MKRSSYRNEGVACSVYDLSSDEDDGEHDNPVVDNDNPDATTEPHPERSSSECRDDDDDDQQSRPGTVAKNVPKQKIFYANFRPSCVAMDAVREHVRCVLDEDNPAVVDTLCANILTESAHRLRNRMCCAKNPILRALCLEKVVSYTTHRHKTTPQDGAIDTITSQPIKGPAFVAEIVYTDCVAPRRFFFQKERAMHTVLSWVRVFRFDAEILKLGKSFSEIDEEAMHNICFDFLQCVRQALFTLNISVGSTKREQLYVTGVTNMDTLVYYVSLTDYRIHHGALGKLSLIVYPDRPKAKRKYS